MGTAEIRAWLDEVWREVLDEDSDDPDEEVDRLVNSSVGSIRYAVLTQLLGKIADRDRSLMFFQLGDEEAGAWDARSFSVAVIVPWVAENHDVIGTSAEPYASKPLRRARLERKAPHIRSDEEWDALHDFFAPLDNAPTKEIESAFRRCLASVARRLSSQSFKYQIPIRVSLPDLCNTLESFLGEPSGGHRALATTTALMEVLGKGFSIFSRVESQGLNEADAARGAPGDVMCFADDGNMVLAIEVKERVLTLADVRASTRKARESDAALSNLLFATPGIREQDQATISESAVSSWAAGLNVYQVEIIELVRSSFVLLGEKWRPALLRQIGAELDKRGDHAHRRAWHTLLSDLGDNARGGALN